MVGEVLVNHPIIQLSLKTYARAILLRLEILLYCIVGTIQYSIGCVTVFAKLLYCTVPYRPYRVELIHIELYTVHSTAVVAVKNRFRFRQTVHRDSTRYCTVVLHAQYHGSPCNLVKYSTCLPFVTRRTLRKDYSTVPGRL